MSVLISSDRDFRLDCFDGTEPVTSAFCEDWVSWAVQAVPIPLTEPTARPRKIDLGDWKDPDVGWGLILRDDPKKDPHVLYSGSDAPEPIQELLAARPGSPVLRYCDGHIGKLRRYYADGSKQDLQIIGSVTGIAKGKLPKYLTICGSPRQIPWELQYVLNGTCNVGRLDLDSKGLKNYVSALLQNWSGSKNKIERTLIWSVDHDESDITHLMRHSVAKPIYDKLVEDPECGPDNTPWLSDSDASWSIFLSRIRNSNGENSLIVTTSHGMTGPLDAPILLASSLGILVDCNQEIISCSKVASLSQLHGCIWYAHACCSAGSTKRSLYSGALEAGSRAAAVLEQIAGIGSITAPLPKALLGMKHPIKAFIGHVEPTFDWTLQNPQSKQLLTSTLTDAVYANLHANVPQPVGMAFGEFFLSAGKLLSQWNLTLNGLAGSAPAEREKLKRRLLLLKLTGIDRTSWVILGDPTVSLPNWSTP